MRTCRAGEDVMVAAVFPAATPLFSVAGCSMPQYPGTGGPQGVMPREGCLR